MDGVACVTRGGHTHNGGPTHMHPLLSYTILPGHTLLQLYTHMTVSTGGRVSRETMTGTPMAGHPPMERSFKHKPTVSPYKTGNPSGRTMDCVVGCLHPTGTTLRRITQNTHKTLRATLRPTLRGPLLARPLTVDFPRWDTCNTSAAPTFPTATGGHKRHR
jgi:hypothetical protein